MTDIQIITTQNVVLNFKVAELGVRILAWLIDWCVKLGYGFLAFFVYALFEDVFFKNIDGWSMMALYIVFGSPVIFYTLFFETLYRGQTPGKRVMKLRVLKIDGYQVSLGDFLIRWIMRLVDISMFSGAVAAVSIGSSKHNQRLGDLASGTVVVHFKKRVGIDNTILEELAEDYQPVYTSVLKLSDNDIRIIKDYYEKDLKNNNPEMMIKLREKIIAVIGDKPLPNHSTKTFIATVIKDYNYYTQNIK